MLTDLFGEFSQGKVGRLRFLLLSLALSFGLILVGVGLGCAAAWFDTLTSSSGGTPATSALGLLVSLLAAALYILGVVNLVAKRARDIGWSVALLIVLFILFSGITWIVLALVRGLPAAAEGAPA